MVHSPKGTVGIVSPWNVPFGLAIAPATGAVAAGNRIMLKPSELAPATADLLKELVEARFDADEFAVLTGGPERRRAFTRLPFDHLVFTGSTATGRRVLAAAAENLVPVTLELGGKSPAIVGASADRASVLRSLVLGKMLNAGQVCIAPDYVLVPAGTEDAFVAAAAAAARDLFPDLAANPDYGAIIDDAKHARLAALVADAAAKGARVTVAGAAASATRRMPLHLLQDVDDTMLAMREEIFGPILPVIGYASFDEALAFVNARDTPLALYYFGSDAAETGRDRRAHPQRRRDDQRHAPPQPAGRPPLRRRGGVRHGALSRSRRLPGVQPPPRDLSTDADRHHGAGWFPAALRREVRPFPALAAALTESAGKSRLFLERFQFRTLTG